MKELVFVYNTRSGLFNKAADFAHKIIAPNTYDCNLCTITYGNFGAHKEWVDFIQSLKTPVRFLYKNEFKKKYPEVSEKFPSIYLVQNKKPELFMSCAEINVVSNLYFLIEILNRRMERL